MGVVCRGCGDGGVSIPGSKPGSGMGVGWNGCENGVKNLTNYYYELDMLKP